MPKPGLYIFLLIFVTQQLSAQVAPDVKRFSFTHYGLTSGLMSNEVTSVLQDDAGYMWIATTNGLQRFDGVRFITFRNNKTGRSYLPSNHVHQLLMDKKKNLWLQVGEGKAGIFNSRDFSFKEATIRTTNQLHAGHAKKIVQDEEGNIMMVVANSEILTYNEEKNEFSFSHNFIRYPKGWEITDIYNQPGTKKYWIGSQQGIVVYDRKTDQLSYAGHNEGKEGLVENYKLQTSAVNFFLDDKDRLWFDSWEEGMASIYCYDLRKNEWILEKHRVYHLVNAYHEVRGVIQQRNGTIWIRGLGIFAQFIEKEKKFQQVYNGYENEQSIAYTRVDWLFEDREENIWVATNNNGLYRFSPASQFFTNIRHYHRVTGNPGEGSAMSFMMTKQGTLFVGNWGDGLYHYDKYYNKIPIRIRGFDEKWTPSMWSMYLSRDSNTIWMGSQPGIWEFNQLDGSAKFHDPPPIANRTVRQVVEDKLGNLWIGMQSTGVYKWTKEKGKTKFGDGLTQFISIPLTQILKIYNDWKGNVWITTTTFGVYVIDPTTDNIILHFSTKEPAERKLQADGVASVIQYDDSTMIIAANGLYLYDLNKNKITKSIPLPESIPGTIAAMEKDRQGYLWVSMTSGIFRVNPKNEIFIHFDRLDGIANDHFIVSASYTLPDGRLLFGADNQYVVFDPMQVRINEPAPDVTITGFRLMNEPLLIDSLLKRNKVQLTAKDNSIAIDFAGLSYNGTYIIKYKLDGLDKEWIRADNNSQAIYSFLPTGTYTFMVRSEDAEGNPSKNTTRLIIRVAPPFWKTWWFFCLLALVITAVVYWLDKQRMNKLKALQNVRSEIAANLHEEVNTTLNNINLLSEMARIKADKDIERSKSYIDQISTKSHNMIIAMDDILWSIDPKNDNMEKSLLRMMEFADALKNRHSANIELALDKKVRSLELDMKTRHEVFLIFKEALRTIVQSSSGKETLIHIDLFKNKLSIKLQDATATLDKNVAEIDNSIREMHARSGSIKADLDVQCDKNGIAIILLVSVK